MAASDEMSEKQVKDTLRSLLTSNPYVSTVQTLQRDYKELIGQSIPFYQFRYNSLEHFLNSIPDICTVNGLGPFARVYPVVTEKNANINRLVTRQNVTRKRTPLNRRRLNAPFGSSNVERNRGGYNYSFTPNNSPSSASSGSLDTSLNTTAVRNPPIKPQVMLSYERKLTNTANISTSTNSNLANHKIIEKFRDSGKPTSDVISKLQANSLSSQVVQKSCDDFPKEQTKVVNVTQPPVTIARITKDNVEKWNNLSTTDIPHNAPIERCQNMETKDHSSSPGEDLFQKSLARLNKLTSFESAKEVVEEDTSNVPKRVQSNLKALISQFEDGIWSSTVPGHYRKLFRKELSFVEYGYTSLIEMCAALKHIFHYVRPGRDDFKLYDRSKPLPATAEKSYTIASYDIGGRLRQDEALPDLEWSDFSKNLPDDVFKFGNEIPNQFLPEKTKTESVLDVVVVEIYDLSKFWFYLGTSDSPAVLDNLMDDLQNFYNNEENAKYYAIPRGAIKEGLYCVQVIYGEYHRAKIVRLLRDSDEHVRVLYIDYGTVCNAPTKGMCFLRSSFASVPAQAIRCRLANIVPKLKGHPWPKSASNRFRELVNRRDTKIKISYIDWAEEYVCVFLADVTDSSDVLYINEVLVKEKHALWEGETQESPFILPNFKCKVKNLHLFPTFVELEYGLAPNANEMYSLADMLVPLQFCIPQYFEPNEQVVSDDESDVEELDNTFIEIVKIHRKFTPLNKVDMNTIIKAPPIDFVIFGDLMEKIIQFCNRHHLLTNPEVEPDDALQEVLFSDVENDSTDNKDLYKREKEDYDCAKFLNEGRQYSKTIINKLEKYSTCDSERSTSSGSTNDIRDDLLAYSVPVENLLDLQDKFSPDEEILERLTLSTIQEQSDTEIDSSIAGLVNKACPMFLLDRDNIEPDINIFDNPEAFENRSEFSSPPVTPQLFLKAVENKLECQNNSIDYVTSQSMTGCSSETENPFKFEIDHLCDRPQKADETAGAVIGGVNVKREINETFRKDFDLPFKSRLADTKNDFIGSLHLTNPFRLFLEDNDGHKSPETAKVSDMVKTSISTQTDILSRKEMEEELSSDSDGSDYTGFVPKCELNSSESSVQQPTPCSTPLSGASGTCPQPPNVSRPLSEDVQSNISVHAAPFVPMNYPPQQQYPPWSNGGGYPGSQYPLWNNGDKMPGRYSFYPAPRIRPPPGFTTPMYQGPPWANYPNQYMMPRMGPPPMYPLYPSASPYSLYDNSVGPRQMGPSTHVCTQEQDFFERFNEELMKRGHREQN